MALGELAAPCEPPPDLMGLLATAAKAKCGDHLVIAGGGVEPLIDLLHRGFSHAVCAAPGRRLAGEDADVLLIPDAASLDDLKAILAGLGRGLRAAGVAVLYDTQLPTRARIAALNRLLAEHGFGHLVRLPCTAGCLLKTRKAASHALRRAA